MFHLPSEAVGVFQQETRERTVLAAEHSSCLSQQGMTEVELLIQVGTLSWLQPDFIMQCFHFQNTCPFVSNSELFFVDLKKANGEPP